MASRPSNQASGQGSTVRAKAPAKPSKPTAPAGAAPGRYSWGSGPATHSIPLAQHRDNATAQRTLGTNDLTAPPTGAQAIREANASADLKFGPQVQAAQQLNANVKPWFQDYMARVAGYATAAKDQAAPVVQQAQTFQDNTATQLPPGLDPNSEAGKAAAMAAQGRQALAALGTQALSGNAQATQDYFGGVGAMAAKEQPQAQTAASERLANAQGQRGAAVTDFLTTARQNAQNYQIARGTLGLNADKATSDAATKAASTAETVRHHTASETSTAQARKDAAAAKGQTVNKYGFTNEQWGRFSASHRQRVIAEQQSQSQAGANSKDATKHAEAITKASGGVQNTVTDIIGQWQGHVGKETDDTTKPILKNGQPVKGPDGKPTYEPRTLTPADITAIVGQNKAYTPQLIHIARLRMANKPLDQGAIDYLHNLDPNIRIPSAWLPTQGKGVAGRPGNAPGVGGNRPT